MAHSVRRIVAIISAILVWIAAILQVLESFGVIGDDPEFEPEQIRILDPAAVRSYWEYKRSQMQVDIWITLFFSLGLLGLSYCVLCLKRVFKRYAGGDSDLPAFMVGSFFVGAALPCIELLESIGSTSFANLIASTPNFPDVGYQALQIAHTLQLGTGLFLISAQFLFVSIGLSIASFLTFQTKELPVHHGRMGAITATIGFLAFIFEVTAFASGPNPTSIVFGILVILWGLIFLPIWLVWLGVLLKQLKTEQDVTQRRGDDVGLVVNGA